VAPRSSQGTLLFPTFLAATFAIFAAALLTTVLTASPAIFAALLGDLTAGSHHTDRGRADRHDSTPGQHVLVTFHARGLNGTDENARPATAEWSG
jgi:hypothetical protein